MLNRRTRLLVAVLVVAAAAGAAAGAADAAKTVRTVGGLTFQRNAFLGDSVHFTPTTIYVRPNELVTWVDRDRKPEPHTVTVVNRGERPSHANQVVNCRACALANAHLEDPNNPNSPVVRNKVNVGRAGLNTRGDSLYLAPGRRISERVTATAGHTLYYLCAIHPWMQGVIRVTRTGVAPRTHQATPLRGAALTGRTR